MGEHVERVALTARLWEPPTNIRPAHRASSNVGIKRAPRIKRKGRSSPSVKRGLVRVTLNFYEPATCQGSEFWPAEAFEKLNSPFPIRASSSLGTDQHQLGGMCWMTCGVSQRDHAAKGRAQHDRLHYA